VGGVFGDADGSGDVAQADTWVTSHADQDMRVIGQKVPVRSRLPRDLVHISRKVFHELLIPCIHGHGHYSDSASLARTGRVANPGPIANPAPFQAIHRERRVPLVSRDTKR
jgi:hypothetical protein